jgi:peptide/nickel transport system substrate-binding protein
MSKKRMTRRDFLIASATGAVGVVIASCAPAVAPTTAPAATLAPTVEPTKPPVIANTPTPIPTAGPTATAVPTVASSKYKEAPALAEQVKAGKLPPVDMRLPKVPLPLSPIDQIGKYGGRLRKMWMGGWNGFAQEEQYGHSALRWIDDGLGIAPGMCDKWSTNADNSAWTVHVREGLKWSDGQPCTVDDIIWWWDNLTVKGDASYPDPIPDFGQDANGKLVTLTKTDDYTLTLTYGTPSPLTAKRLAMWVNACIGPRWIVPAHYCKKFHPKFNTEIKDFKSMNDLLNTWSNPDIPVLNHWIVTKYDAGKSMTMERNPYYYAVDTAGNQLPYIDGVDYINVQDAQVELLQIRQGSIDHAHFHNQALADVSTLLDNADAGGYEVYMWDAGDGTGECYFPNYDYPNRDPKGKKIFDLYRNPKFKQALSHALDRPTIQKLVYYGMGFPSTGTMAAKAFEFNFNAEAQAFFKKARDIYVAYDPEKAKALLKEAGYAGEEFRIDQQSTAGKTSNQILEIAKKNWEAVGIKVVINPVTGTAFDPLWQSGQGSVHNNWGIGDGPDHLLYPSWMVPNEPARWAPLTGRLLQFAGTEQENTEAEISPWDRKPPRFNKKDPEYIGSTAEKIHKIYAQAIIETDEIKRAKFVWQMWQLHMDEGPFVIGTVANTPYPIIKSKKLTNIPTKEQLKLGGFTGPWIIPSPAVYNPETWSYK